MYKIIVSILLSVFFCELRSQTTQLMPSVIGAQGAQGTSNGNRYYYSVGEPVNYLGASTSFVLTQGYLQPDVVWLGNTLQVTAFSTPVSCKDASDGSITINVTGTHTPFQYAWFRNDTLLPDTTSSIQNLGPGRYVYVITDAIFDSKTDTIVFNKNETPCKIKVHHGITPNGDNNNDYLHIEHIEEFPGNEVFMFNRWGAVIWQTKGYNNTTNSWKGDADDGTSLAAGTYFYIIKLDGIILKGWIELIK